MTECLNNILTNDYVIFLQLLIPRRFSKTCSFNNKFLTTVDKLVQMKTSIVIAF